MKKKKPRSITVDGNPYTWAATGRVDECELPITRIRIWEKKKIILEREIPEQAITPKIVAEMIRNHLSGKIS